MKKAIKAIKLALVLYLQIFPVLNRVPNLHQILAEIWKMCKENRNFLTVRHSKCSSKNLIICSSFFFQIEFFFFAVS